MQDYRILETRLGIVFTDKTLLELALTHPSFAVDFRCKDNQRLEFLGDAVLQIRVSEVLYTRYPQIHEGQLTRRRSALVCEANLAKAAKALGLGDWLRLSHGEEALGGRERPSILADAMEAVVAAVYLDQGYETTCGFVDRILNGYEAGEKDHRDAKSRLQEYLQAQGETAPTYEEVAAEGPANARIFTARAIRGDGTEIGQGKGRRKQWAEEAAAEQALASLKKK